MRLTLRLCVWKSTMPFYLAIFSRPVLQYSMLVMRVTACLGFWGSYCDHLPTSLGSLLPSIKMICMGYSKQDKVGIYLHASHQSLHWVHIAQCILCLAILTEEINPSHWHNVWTHAYTVIHAGSIHSEFLKNAVVSGTPSSVIGHLNTQQCYRLVSWILYLLHWHKRGNIHI